MKQTKIWYQLGKKLEFADSVWILEFHLVRLGTATKRTKMNLTYCKVKSASSLDLKLQDHTEKEKFTKRWLQ